MKKEKLQKKKLQKRKLLKKFFFLNKPKPKPQVTPMTSTTSLSFSSSCQSPPVVTTASGGRKPNNTLKSKHNKPKHPPTPARKQSRVERSDDTQLKLSRCTKNKEVELKSAVDSRWSSYSLTGPAYELTPLTDSVIRFLESLATEGQWIFQPLSNGLGIEVNRSGTVGISVLLSGKAVNIVHLPKNSDIHNDKYIVPAKMLFENIGYDGHTLITFNDDNITILKKPAAASNSEVGTEIQIGCLDVTAEVFNLLNCSLKELFQVKPLCILQSPFKMDSKNFKGRNMKLKITVQEEELNSWKCQELLTFSTDECKQRFRCTMNRPQKLHFAPDTSKIIVDVLNCIGKFNNGAAEFLSVLDERGNPSRVLCIQRDKTSDGIEVSCVVGTSVSDV